MRLNKNDDPRSNLQKAGRRELVEFAHANGQLDINEDMPADDDPWPGGRIGIRTILQQRGFTNIRSARASMGHAGRHQTLPIAPPRVAASAPVDEWAEFQKWKQSRSQQQIVSQPSQPSADLAAQWARNRQHDLDTGKTKRPERHNPMNDLRAKAKELGIKVDRRDNANTLRAKVEAHGKVAS